MKVVRPEVATSGGRRRLEKGRSRGGVDEGAPAFAEPFPATFVEPLPTTHEVEHAEGIGEQSASAIVAEDAFESDEDSVEGLVEGLMPPLEDELTELQPEAATSSEKEVQSSEDETAAAGIASSTTQAPTAPPTPAPSLSDGRHSIPTLTGDPTSFTHAAPQLRGGGYTNPVTGWWFPFYVGTLKSFNTRSGYGFLECKETFAIYRSDVYIHKSQVPFSWKLGQLVEFGVMKNRHEQPQAIEPLWLPMVAPKPEDDSNRQNEKATFSKRYMGTLKSFSFFQGTGFIASEDLRTKRSCDVYLDRAELPELGPLTLGQVVEFETVDNEKGQPQARHVDWNPVLYLRGVDSAALVERADHGRQQSDVRILDKILGFLRAQDSAGAVKMAIKLQEGSEQIDYVSFVLEHLGRPSPTLVAELSSVPPVLLLITLSKLLGTAQLSQHDGRAAAAIGWCVTILDSAYKIQDEKTARIVRKNIEMAAIVEAYTPERSVLQFLLEWLSNYFTSEAAENRSGLRAMI